jgi:site-specific recombinase XerD
MRTEIVKASKASVSATGGGPILPVIIAQAGDHAACRFIELFIATIHNPNTRRAYAKAVADFFAWAAGHGLTLPRIEPVHVAAYIDQLSAQQRLQGVQVHRLDQVGVKARFLGAEPVLV